RRRHTRSKRDWSSDVCSSDLQQQQQEEVQNRMMLISAAKSGDPQAIESLTLEDIDTYSKVSRRLVTEDVFSIVDTYIMPYGVERSEERRVGKEWRGQIGREQE